MSKKSIKIKGSEIIKDHDYLVMKYLNDTQKISQRKLSQSLNISLGKVNYILKISNLPYDISPETIEELLSEYS